MDNDRTPLRRFVMEPDGSFTELSEERVRFEALQRATSNTTELERNSGQRGN